VDWDISSKFGMPVDFHLPKRVPSPKPNPEVDFRLCGRHLKKSIWHYNFATDSPITTKFDRLMQNDLPMTMHRSKSKPEEQFQYGGRPFSETGSSFILAVDWDISWKFSMQINVHLVDMCHCLFDCNFGISWAIVCTRNEYCTCTVTYLMAWWRHNY